MRKIISLFKRHYDSDHLVYNEIVPGAEWVVNGEGLATRKLDGTCCMVKEGILYKRYDVKKGKTPPQGFIPAQDPDVVTGHWPGWVKVDLDSAANKYHAEAFVRQEYWPDGTYELCGDKINGNPEQMVGHVLIAHNLTQIYPDAPRNFNGLKAWFIGKHIEGIVWHRHNGDMVKIKKRDFGLQRNE